MSSGGIDTAEFHMVPAAGRDHGQTNAMSVDVEEYFQVSALAPYIDGASWSSIPSRVERSIDRILQMFADADASATFFTLGWVAERHPRMIRRIVDAGHELASHGYRHARVTSLTPDTFRDDVLRTKGILEDTGGVAVTGYRAPSYSVDASNLWALDILAETGHRYSSSIYPISHDHYGMREAPRFSFRTRDAAVLEVPVTTVSAFGRRLPCGGGGYFRLLPYAWFHWAIQRVNSRDGRAAVFYFHPWEIDREQPRVPGIDVRTRFRHYVNLRRMEDRLVRLLGDFRWDRMDRIYGVSDEIARAPLLQEGVRSA